MTMKDPLEEYKIFLASQDSPDALKTSIDLSMITKDLVPNSWHLAFWYFGFSVIGYLVSLLICAQNSLGFSGVAHHVAAAIHRLPDPWCPIICGAVFTGIPAILTSVFLNRFQHRYLVFKMWWFFAAIPVLGTFLMILLPQSFRHLGLDRHMTEFATRPNALTDVEWMMVWAVSAILFPYLIELFVWRFVSPKKDINRA